MNHKEEHNHNNEQEGQLLVDIYKKGNDIIIKSMLAGVSPKDLHIEISDEVVTIKGKRDLKENVSDEDYYFRECYFGPFSRTIILPTKINKEKSSAKFENGILTITLPILDSISEIKIDSN